MEPIGLVLSPTPSDTFNKEQCIICQEDTIQATISHSNGRKRIRESADIRKDSIAKRLKLLVEDPENIVYHMNNECYKIYTLISSHKAVSSKLSQSRPGMHTARSKHQSREPPTQKISHNKQKCVICNKLTHKKEYKK